MSRASPACTGSASPYASRALPACTGSASPYAYLCDTCMREIARARARQREGGGEGGGGTTPLPKNMLLQAIALAARSTVVCDRGYQLAINHRSTMIVQRSCVIGATNWHPRPETLKLPTLNPDSQPPNLPTLNLNSKPGLTGDRGGQRALPHPAAHQ